SSNGIEHRTPADQISSVDMPDRAVRAGGMHPEPDRLYPVRLLGQRVLRAGCRGAARFQGAEALHKVFWLDDAVSVDEGNDIRLGLLHSEIAKRRDRHAWTLNHVHAISERAHDWQRIIRGCVIDQNYVGVPV